MEAALLAPYFCSVENEMRIEHRPRVTKGPRRRLLARWWRALVRRQVALAPVGTTREPAP
jgi:hypothetical protein